MPSRQLLHAAAPRLAWGGRQVGHSSSAMKGSYVNGGCRRCYVGSISNSPREHQAACLSACLICLLARLACLIRLLDSPVCLICLLAPSAYLPDMPACLPDMVAFLPCLSAWYACLQIDLDTIETSNLNRQFLFRRKHVGQSKAQVAAQVVQAFAPAAHIKAYQVRQTLRQLCTSYLVLRLCTKAADIRHRVRSTTPTPTC